ncbi:class I SAM-dependent methyltransferase [Paenibacillus psychroresistens]|uniref:Class I SAM-dependent methyltransferase n=1 Tax=Paenibacillus psychroresistens TaxID=1778678 RepID=A0A6B8RUN5_9BACL|nr:class I SAM-dependent methyltransferase [Paenibacillus psychroresistens]QGQ99542.1 class I SAM-dependent methyltransferase [Paenibacillus psychroresistens]
MSKKISFGNVAQEYAKYRDQLPDVIFEQLRERNVVFENKKAIDLGAGSGIFSRALANQGVEVYGIEPEYNLINEARLQDHVHNKSITYLNSVAEEIDLPDQSFDLITALRAWHWFERIKVLEEVNRLLKPEGHLIIIHAIFLPHISAAAQQSLNIIRSNGVDIQPAGSMAYTAERRNGFPVNWFEEWLTAELQIVDEWQYNYDLTFTIDEWCGKVNSLSWLTNADEALKDRISEQLKASLGNAPLIIPHQYSVVLLKKSQEGHPSNEC